MQMEISTPQEIVAAGIRNGWVKPPARPQRKLTATECTRIRRAEYIAQGLNSRGKPRRNQPRPELRGLTGREYHTAYMQRQRKGLL